MQGAREDNDSGEGNAEQRSADNDRCARRPLWDNATRLRATVFRASHLTHAHYLCGYEG